jgi:flagellar hook-basal body complex protein FliE
MTATSALAANAYKIAQGLANRHDQGQAPGSPIGPDFGAMVRDALGGVIDQGRAADAKARSFASGKTDVVDMVTAVAETEVALETMVSLRDKVISAYEEIMRMPI